MSSIDPFSASIPSELSRIEDSNQIILLRHASAKIDPTTPPEKWELDKEGIEQANQLVLDTRLQTVDVIYSSPAQKALQSVAPLADILDIPVIELSDLRECHLDRYYDDFELFQAMKILKFTDPNFELGESHTSGLDRISSTVNGVRRYNANKTILLVTHGTLMTLFIADYYNYTQEEMIAYWKNIRFCQLEFI